MKFAMGILLTGRWLGTADAVRMGVVDEAVPAADLDATVDRWLEWLRACVSLSLRAAEPACHQADREADGGPATSAGAGDPAAGARGAAHLGGRDGGTNAFKEKHPTAWKGR